MPQVVHKPRLHRRKVGGGRAEDEGHGRVAEQGRWLSAAASRLLAPMQADPAVPCLGPVEHAPHCRTR